MPETLSAREDDILRCAEHLRRASRVLVLTGAGISAESGVPTFRGPGGLWRSFRPEDLATPKAFASDPRLVWEWYAWRRGLIAPLRPNRAHQSLAALEDRVAGMLLATQNVDGLHAVAGSRAMVELHGSLWRVRCTGGCGRVADDRRVPLPEIPPRCDCGALLRPDVVWFGEALPWDALARAAAAAREAEVVLVVGTSSLVYPAAMLPDLARERGAFVIEVNPKPTPLTPAANVSLRGHAADVVPPLVEASA
jgi:NAD-dependent deacetylase